MQRKLSRWILALLAALLTLGPGLAAAQMCPAPNRNLTPIWLDGDETGAGDGADGGEALQCEANLGGNATDDPSGMMRASVQSLLVSLAISDRPLAYRPAKGPAVPLSLYYSQREAGQPERFHYANLGPKWTYSGLSYIIDDPERPGEDVQRYKAGGGTRRFQRETFDAASGRFAPDGRDGSTLVRRTNPVRYERLLPDGGLETYAHTDGQKTWPRRFFLTERKDPAGNALQIHYDSQNRITVVLDAAGGKTLLEYKHDDDPLKITGIVDPAGRRARIEYDARGRLVAITDALGLVSKVSYSGRGTFIERMQTPYGITRFASGSGADRWVEITDPLGRTERFEARESVATIADVETNAPQIPGIDNQELSRRNTFYWDAVAHARHKGDYSKARILHWRQEDGLAVGVLSSVKEPLENRQWYTYDPKKTGGNSCAYPLTRARVLPDGETQTVRHAWNALGNKLMSIDPLGRETRYDYAQNDIDLTRVRQKSAQGWDTLAELTWNTQHRPVAIKNAAGQTTKLVWNQAGQLASRTGPLGGTTRYEYDRQGRLAQIIDPQGKVQAQYAYDKAGNIASESDSEGYTLKHEYDALNRRTQTVYPDGTTSEYTWNRLDLVKLKDRNGKHKSYEYDSARRLVAEREGLRTIRYAYDEAGRRTQLVDGNGHVTKWQYDLQGRVTGKTTADGVKTLYEYDSAGRQVKRIDALGQERILSYAKDDAVLRIEYRNAIHPTPEVRLLWDKNYPRINEMHDGTGVTGYTYGHAGAPGALKLKEEDGPAQNDTYRLAYDRAGRIEHWRVDAEGAENYSYDALGRIQRTQNALGAFDYDYLGGSGRITGMALAGTPLKRGYAYEAIQGDQRLKHIEHPAGARSYTYTSAPENLITALTETTQGQSRQWHYDYDEIDRLTGADSSDGKTYRYWLDAGDNLTTIAGPEGTRSHAHDAGNRIEGYQYDANGNLTEDASRTYQWDAENRLIGIGYKSEGQKKTQFRYDGKGRRIAVIETNGKHKTETRYTWCGDQICAARDAKDRPLAYYFSEGVYRVAGKKKEYYARDHLGSIRDVLDEKGQNLARYDYAPYGQLLSAPKTAPEFGYAGMHYHAPSGLYLTKYRAYDPKESRWLTRDPIEEAGGINLYGYVGGNPVSYIDPLGLYTEIIIWQPVGWGTSSFGHVSANINGKNFSWAPGGWDTKYPKAADYAARQITFRSGVGVILNLTPEQEEKLVACYQSRSGGEYSTFSNSCGTQHNECLKEVLGMPISNSLLPVNIGNDLLDSPYYGGIRFYEGPERGWLDDGFWVR